MAVLGEILEEAWRSTVSFVKMGGFTRGELMSVLIMLVVGIIGGRIIGEVVRRLLSLTSLDDISVKTGVHKALRRIGYSGSITDLLADLVRYGFYLIVVFGIFNLLGAGAVMQYLEQVMSILPRIVIAVLVLVIGWVVSSRLEIVIKQLFRTGSIRELIDETDPSIPAYTILAKFVKVLGVMVSLVVGFAVIGVNNIIVNALAIILVLGLVAIFIVAGWKVIQNIAISLYLQVSQTFTAGEVITVDGREGEVTHITPLYTKLSDGDATFLVPNTQLIEELIEKKE